MPTTFKAKTAEAYQIKVLAELLKDNLKAGCFEIDDYGICLRQMDNNRKTMIDLQLLSENFCPYRFKSTDKKIVGLTLTHFYRMLKTIKKKDSLQFIIDAADERQLAIKAIPKENARVTTSFITIQSMQSVEVELPSGYGKPVIINSSEFQKTCKDLLNIGTTITIESFGSFGIRFCSDADGILKRRVEFGEPEDSGDDEEDDIPNLQQTHYKQTFETEQLSRISKIAGLSQNMQIFCAINRPLMLRSSIGSLGKISIYIKSIEEVNSENNNDIANSDSNSDSDSE
jgi:proliferating cell nuclear antigen PCNA